MSKSVYTHPILLAAACAVVGGLAVLGTFNSIFNFPLVFAAVCLAFGGLDLWRLRPRRALVRRGAILLAGAGLAVGGWAFQRQALQDHLALRRQEILVSLAGQTVPGLQGLEPLNTAPAAWDEAASLTAPATIVSFWARWCSPCWKEMPELQKLYEQHRDRGLRVVAVTRYDRPQDEKQRQSDFSKAQKFLRSRELTYPAAMTDDPELYSAYRVRSLPTTLLVDEQGRVVDYALSLDSARALMRRAARLVTTAPAG